MSLELQEAIEAAKKAGKQVLEIYNKDFKAFEKAKDDFVTEADLSSEKIILECLSKYNYGVLAEETKDDLLRLNKNKVWIIDPLDGTSDFVNKTDEFSIMIGLVENQEPILGVIYQPIKDKLYYGEKGKGAYLIENGYSKRLKVSDVSTLSDSRFVFTKFHLTNEIKGFIEKHNIKPIHMGSAGLKIGFLAEAKAEVYLTFTDKTCQWDTCAGEVILREAGGEITDLQGNKFVYNREQTNNPKGVVCTNKKIHQQILKII